MDAFPDGTHVRLSVREYDEAYLYASDDEGGRIGFSEDAHGWLDAAWAVHRLEREGTDYVLLHSASYGRYLALVEGQAEDEAEDEDEVEVEIVYYRPGQCTYDSPEQENVLFQARIAEDGSDDIYLRNRRFGDWCGDDELPLHWVVEAIPERQHPPGLPDPPQPSPPPEVPFALGGPICLARRGVPAVPPQAVLRRRINYVLADDQANFHNLLQWRVLEPFEGQSVFNLRRDLAKALGHGNNYLGITLCVSGGSNGRWTPLVVDLPPDEKTMNIVVFTTGSPAALALRHPDVDAQEE